MFERITRRITTQEQFEGFKKSADGVANPRKWAVYESIAQQIEARGQIPKPAPQDDPLLERFRQYMEKRESWQTD